ARSYVFDITGAMHDTTGRVRFTFLFKTYIDMIGFDTSADQTLEVTEVPMESATLGWHGIDAKTATGDIYDYAYGQTGSPIPTIPGTYTKFGNVTSLLHGTDDKFFIYGTCDEIQMRFEPVAAPAQGLNRRYVAFIDGYYKSDKSLVPLEVSPLPFSAMSNYPYPETESYPADSDHATYLSQWNTRVETGEPRVPVGEAGLTDDGTHRSLNVDYVSLEVGYQDATASTAGGCSMCHNVHGQPDAETGAMTVGSVWKSEDRLCTGDGASGCHASTTASSAGVNIAAAFSGTDPRMHHDVAPKDQRATGSKIACSSCHNPHRDSGGSKISNPDAKGSAATGTSRYLNADGKMYVLVGALHDGAKPVISAVSLDASALFTAPRVSWTTNEVASTWIDWGTTTSYGETAGGNTPVTSHSVVMSGLTANVTYHYRLRSADQLGNEQVSADYTYTPLAPPALPVPTPAPDTAFDNGAGVPYTLSWSAVTSPDGDPVQYQLVVDATAYPWQSANSKTLTMWGGQHSWKVRVRDAVHIDAATPYTEADVFYVTDNTIYSGSCPFLFTWDGDSYEFEADTFVGGRIGTKRGASYLRPTPSDSYVVRTPVAEKDGSLEFRLVEERYETDYLDKISLKAVDAPAGARVFAEKPVSGAPYPTFPGSLHTVRDLRAPLSARHLNSDTDVLGKISADDGEQLVLNEQREADFTYQTIEMDLGDVADAPKVKIVMDAVSCFPVTTEGLAHSATFNSRTKLEVQDNAGVWQTVPTSVASLTLPPEFSRPFIFDITNAARSSSGKVRFTYLYKTYIDSIQVDTSADEPITVTDVPLDSATLASHGVDEQTGNGDISEFNYGEAVSQGELFPGAYTKYGDVSPLLSGSDDKFVIAGQGDELTLRFTPPAEPAQGLARQFVFDVDGYYKDAKTDLARTVEPLPFHAMSNYPYPSTESYPSDAEHDAYRVEWNTRIVEAESNQAAASTGSLLARLVEAVESAFDSVRDAAVALLDGGTNRIVVAKADETQRIHYSVNTDRLGVRLTLQDGSLATAAVANAWQSTGSAPTPAGPGSVVVAASTQIAAKDGDYWITDLATTDRNTNWQLAEVQLTESARKSVHNVFVEWVGHGEPTATYPTSLYLWNFETNAWDVKASGQAATDLAFNAEEEQTDNSFCLKCHDGTAPSGVTLPAGSRDIATAWTATTGDVHGAAVGSGNYQSGLSPEYKAGQPAIPCGTCHDSHGTGNLYHLRSTINGKSGISAATGSTVESACRACHTGDAGVWHQSCNDCHFDPESHVSAPYVGAGQDCASCHSHAKTWSHPASCHCGPWPSTFKTF
ncbi:MAG TPA: hypothetical protein VLA05_10735, partial [Coriobacteriia bacterium]|nr:hypothetical protein [Coriobacteriia bacterium]